MAKPVKPEKTKFDGQEALKEEIAQPKQKDPFQGAVERAPVDGTPETNPLLRQAQRLDELGVKRVG